MKPLQRNAENQQPATVTAAERTITLPSGQHLSKGCYTKRTGLYPFNFGLLRPFQERCCDVVKLPLTNNESKQLARNHKLSNQRKTKNLLSTVNFSKAYPLYKCQSASFYRETNGLFTYRDRPRVKRIELECTRLILGHLHRVFT
jgi:hypothetical protein